MLFCILCISSVYVISCWVLNKYIKFNMVLEVGVFEVIIFINRSKIILIEWLFCWKSFIFILG